MSNVKENENVKENKGSNKFKKKWDYTLEELKTWPNGKRKVVISKNKYDVCYLKYNIIPDFPIIERIDIADYKVAFYQNKVQSGVDEVSWLIPYRILKGVSDKTGREFYVIEFFVSADCRLSFFIKDKVIRSLATMGESLNYEEIQAEENEFDVFNEIK